MAHDDAAPIGDAIQDVLLVMYLSNVTKMQLMLAEKLQTASLLV